MNDKDRELIQKLEDGAEWAWAEVYRLYFDRLVRYMQLKYGMKGEAARDVVQQTFLELLEILREGKAPWTKYSTLYWYLVSLTNQTSKEQDRHDNRQKRGGGWKKQSTEDGAVKDSLVDANPTPAQAAELPELQEDVRDALNELPDGERAVVWLVDLEGWCCSDAAEVLDIPEGTLKSRLGRGRAKLRFLLKDCGPE